MTKVFLAAGVASLAIAAPAVAGPHGNHGDRGGEGQQAQVNRGGGGGGHAGGGFSAPRQQRQSAPRFEQRQQRMSMPRMEQRSQRFAMERPQHSQRVEMRQQRADRAQSRVAARQEARPTHVQQQRVASHQMRANREQAQNRQQIRAERIQQAQNRQQIRPERTQQAQNRQQLRVERTQQAQNRQQLRMNNQDRMAMRQQVQANRVNEAQDRMALRQQVRAERQQAAQNLLAERHALRADRIANADAFRASRFASLVETPRTRFIAPAQAVQFVGQPVDRVNNYVTLSALPSSVSYLYPATPDYYYQYGDGYLYQIDRSSSIIDALIPLLAGGFLPGTYLPQPYMASYVPSYYGLNSWYPASYSYGYGYGAGYGGYGYGYPTLCNRYAYGTVYQVDCVTGMVVNVIPTYAGGYGVGQMLPSAYSYYNLPMQYRDMYYPTADYSYWYAPGAIYQYDTRSSLITSVAALMSPGFTIGQPLPVGYNMYNVPMAYRATYYDTANAWYRYNNGYIYQVDPSTMLVTSIVASLLT